MKKIVKGIKETRVWIRRHLLGVGDLLRQVQLDLQLKVCT